MNKDIILAPVSRRAAKHSVEQNLISRHHSDHCECVTCEVYNALRSALATDRKELTERVAELLMWEDGIDDTGQIYGPDADLTDSNQCLRDEYESKSRAVLKYLENSVNHD